MKSRPPTTDDEATEVYDSQRQKRPTERGHAGARAESLKEAQRRRAIDERGGRGGVGGVEGGAESARARSEIELATPTEITPLRDRSEPIRVISMKTPAELAAEQQGERTPHVQRPKLRPMSEVSQQNARANDLGRLAPPRDAKGVRARKLRDFVLWGSVVIVVGCAVMLAVWFLARR